MKKWVFLFLKVCTAVPAILALILGGIGGYALLTEGNADPQYAPVLYPIVAILYIWLIPLCFCLVRGIRLLNLTEKGKFLSAAAEASLSKLLRPLLICTALFICMLPFVYQLAQLDDAPGLVIIGSVPAGTFAFLSAIIYTLREIVREVVQA